MTSIDQLRRDAKSLGKAFGNGEMLAKQRVESNLQGRDPATLKHADYLHVIAREQGYASWPRLVFAVETHGLDRATKRQRLMVALVRGQTWRVEQVLSDIPDLAEDDLHLACALYDQTTVERLLRAAPERAVEPMSDRTPLVWLASSRWCHARPDLEGNMLAIAELLHAHGANVNDGQPIGEGHQLSPLYLAIGASDNMVLGRWLLEHGADPNDMESLYHATELGHREGLRLLLEHGADPTGTNALLRAMDFDDVTAVEMLLEAGADPNEYNEEPVGGELPWVWPALHQAARRMCSANMVEVLLQAGADPDRPFLGMTPYAMARIFGNAPMARLLEARGADVALTEIEQKLARIADGDAGITLSPDALPAAAAHIVRVILHLPGKLDHVAGLVAAGLPFDAPDAEGLTPVQVAGWEGLPEVMAYFLSLKPDLTHVNGYGGTLLSTILHGSENNPDRTGRDYEACLRLALEAGVDLPRRASQVAGVPELAAFLADWAEAHPEQVVKDGVL